MKKIKMNFDELEKSFVVINEEENALIKGGDWAQDFFDSHSEGVYTGGYVGLWLQDNGYMSDSPWGNYGGYGTDGQPFNLEGVVVTGSLNPGYTRYGYTSLALAQIELGTDFGTLAWYDTNDYGSGGGEYVPEPKNYMNLVQSDMQALFPTEMSSNLLTISSKTDIPVGYTLNANGSYRRNSDGETHYGVTYKSGDLTFVYISPYMYDAELDQNTRSGLIGHELIHAQNIAEHSDMYNDPAQRYQFNLNSELAGNTYQYNNALIRGDQVTAAALLAEINDLISKGATGGFSFQLTP